MSHCGFVLKFAYCTVPGCLSAGVFLYELSPKTVD